MIIGIPRESLEGENRVPILPSDIKHFISKNIKINIESNLGNGVKIQDDEYIDQGATVVDNIYKNSDLIIKINPPNEKELKNIKPNTSIVSLLSPFTNHSLIKFLAKNNNSAFCLELIPRSTYAQSMDVLSSQATVAGYKAVLNAANHMNKFFPMLMTPAGTIKPATILVLGAGVAGLQAIATASRLGAKVEAFDVRPAAREQVESLGAKFLYMDLDDSAETDSGYAIEMNDEFIKKEMELLHDASKRVDAIITTALIFGKKAPILIKDYMVNDMKSGSCIIDLAAENGGNCELTKPGEIITHSDIIIDGQFNLPSQVPYHASQMLSKNISKLLNEIVKNDTMNFNMENDIIKGCLVTHNGEITHEMTKKIIKGNE